MSEIHLGCWGKPELSPPPATCKPSFSCAAPQESCHGQGHFLGLKCTFSRISTSSPAARCFDLLVISGRGRAVRHLRARQGLLGLNLAIVSYTLKSPLFAPSWLAVSEWQVSGRALHVLASGCLLRMPAAQRGSVAAARARSRNPCFVSDNGPVCTLLCVCWQAWRALCVDSDHMAGVYRGVRAEMRIVMCGT
jgi:hypothetical protein